MYRVVQIANIFMHHIFKLHGIPNMIIFDWDVKFTSTFWKALFEGIGTQLHFSMAYHLQTDGQTGRVIKVIKYTLHVDVMQQPTKWEDYLHLAIIMGTMRPCQWVPLRYYMGASVGQHGKF